MTTPNFDRIARAYRWLEYLTLGLLLERTRNHYLPRLATCTQALILGDGDGRFTTGLLAANPHLHADAVDLSPGMLHLLLRRSQAHRNRLRTYQADARTFTPHTPPDLLVTHFFLDCLTQPEVDELVARLTPNLAPRALWLLSDFRIPTGPLHWPARIYIRLLYLAFRLLTGLRVTQLPDHASTLRRHGFTPIATHHILFGLLTTELWQKDCPPPLNPSISVLSVLSLCSRQFIPYHPPMPYPVPALAILLTLAAPALAQSIATNSPMPLSTRVVAYNIDAQIDVNRKTVDATETLTYKNLTGQPLASFPFHLYLNGFQPESTFTSETHFGGGIRDSESGNEYPDKKRGSITISHLEADNFGDLTPLLHFIAPDDHNANDRTVAELSLPHPIAPGDSITFRIRFHDVFPESVARNGYKRDFLMGGQWYPKLGVFWHGAWNCHQYHATTEFFSDFATFNVNLTLARNYTVGASGVPTGDRTNSDGTRTLSFYGEDIHDFAWAASPHFTVTTGTYLSSMGPVQVRVLALASHPKAGQRYLDILLGSLRQFDQRYGPYPYKILTLIDPEPGSEIGGMEYPTLITGDTNWFEPTHITEITAEHEFGHQYWYGMVATNEFEDAWLDEGINSYTEVKVTGALLGRETNALDFGWANASDAFALQYGEYISIPDFDPVTRFAYKFRNTASYASITYGKTATLLATLEGLIGADTMDEAMRTYFMRFRFTHPTTEDFLRTIEEVAIRNHRSAGIMGPIPSCPDGPCYDPPSPVINSSLRPYFNQAVYGTAILDYAIDDISSGPAQWWLPDSPKSKQDKTLRNTVTIHRLGDFLLPVTLEVVFSDHTRRREQWDPLDASKGGENDRWHTYTYLTTAKIVSAEIDPDHTILLDVNRFNNSRTIAANSVPARKLTNLWLSFQQLTSQLAGWLV